MASTPAPEIARLAATPEALRDLLARRARLDWSAIWRFLVKVGLATEEEASAIEDLPPAERDECLRHLASGPLRTRFPGLFDVLIELAAIPRVDLHRFSYEPAALLSLPLEVARRFGVMPLLSHGPSLVVATSVPFDPEVHAALRFAAQRPIVPVFADSAAISAAAARAGITAFDDAPWPAHPALVPPVAVACGL
jgi:hypothetical protein